MTKTTPIYIYRAAAMPTNYGSPTSGSGPCLVLVTTGDENPPSTSAQEATINFSSSDTTGFPAISSGIQEQQPLPLVPMHPPMHGIMPFMTPTGPMYFPKVNTYNATFAQSPIPHPQLTPPPEADPTHPLSNEKFSSARILW